MSSSSNVVKEPTGHHPLTYKPLVDDFDPTLWARLTSTVVKDYGVEDFATADRIVNQAIAYLLLCKEKGGYGYGPSLLVDLGWHAFILHTERYYAFCMQVIGHFVHHEPSNRPGVSYTGNPTIADTVAAIRSCRSP